MLMRSAQVLATMPSIQCRLLISPSQAAQAIWVEGSGSAARISSSESPMCMPSSSRISQCALPWPCSWSAITSSVQARMMLSRVSQSVQLVATRSLRTELRCRVFKRCWRTKLRAEPGHRRADTEIALRDRGIAEQCLARALECHAALLDHAAAVGDREAQTRVLLGEQDRQALPAQALDHPEDLGDQHGRQAQRGLVQ